MTNGLLRALPRAWWLGAAVLLAPVAAHAEDEVKPYPECTRSPSDSDITAAKAAFQAGNVSFNEADYPRAILYWEDAYRRDCGKHQMLLNLARAYELNGNKKQAVVALETFVDREPNAPDKAQITRRIEVLKKQIESEDAAAAQQQQQQQATAEQAAQPKPTESAPPPTGEQAAPEPQGSRPITPLIVAGAGGVLLIGGTILYSLSAKRADELDDQCTPPGNRDVCPDGVAEEGNAARFRQSLGGGIAIAGGAAVVGGIIWYFVAPREQATAALNKPRTAVLPSVSPGFTGVSLSGAF